MARRRLSTPEVALAWVAAGVLGTGVAAEQGVVHTRPLESASGHYQFPLTLTRQGEQLAQAATSHVKGWAGYDKRDASAGAQPAIRYASAVMLGKALNALQVSGAGADCPGALRHPGICCPEQPQYQFVFDRHTTGGSFCLDIGHAEISPNSANGAAAVVFGVASNPAYTKLMDIVDTLNQPTTLPYCRAITSRLSTYGALLLSTVGDLQGQTPNTEIVGDLTRLQPTQCDTNYPSPPQVHKPSALK